MERVGTGVPSGDMDWEGHGELSGKCSLSGLSGGDAGAY